MSIVRRFKDRTEAGIALASELQLYAGKNAVVLALPRGGVPVAHVIAKILELPLDIFLVRKLGLPGHEEFAMGAIASGGFLYLQEQVVHAYGVSDRIVEMICDNETRELKRREQAYREGRDPHSVAGKIVILVDDGIATGASMKVAIQALRQMKPAKIVIAVPVAETDSLNQLRSEGYDCVCLMTPEPFGAVGLWYERFEQVSDEAVIQALDLASVEC